MTISTGNNSMRTALITGASSGIGQAFARRLGAEGYNLVVVGRRRDRLEELVAELSSVEVRVVVADLGTDAGVEAIAEICALEELSMLINNAGVAHYMPFSELPASKASELLHVKVVAPTMLARAAAPGMVAKGEGTIINVSGMLAFGAPVPNASKRAVYVATLAHILALSQTLHEELKVHGLRVQALCPGIVATEFHERQGLDLSAVPRMSAEDVVTASLRGLMLGEVVCAPGVEKAHLLEAVFRADLEAFGAQAPHLAERYLHPQLNPTAAQIARVHVPEAPPAATSEQ
jgi:short-subunit dehydrogenase